MGNSESNCSKFRFSIKADWVKIFAASPKQTNAKGVKSLLASATKQRTGFDAHDRQAGDVFSQFSFNYQNPEGPAALQRVFDRLSSWCEPALAGWEVALDAEPKRGTTQLEAAAMVVDMFLSNSYRLPDGYAWRIYRGTHAEAIPTNRERLVQKVLDGWCLAVGNQRDDDKGRYFATPVAYRGYLKRWDDGQELPEGNFVARFEVTLRGEQFPFRHPSDLNDFDFAEWNRRHGFFNFRVLDTSGMNPFAASLANLALPGRCAKDADCKRRKHRRGSKANTLLNRKVKDAANALTRRWAKAPACRKSTTCQTENPVTVREASSFTEDYNYKHNHTYSPSTGNDTTTSTTTPNNPHTADNPPINDVMALSEGEAEAAALSPTSPVPSEGNINSLKLPVVKVVGAATTQVFEYRFQTTSDKRLDPATLQRLKTFSYFIAQAP